MTDYYDLGDYSRPISTKSSEAQAWFDRGLLWCYGYNHQESVACFKKAVAADPGCAMAQWGIGYAAGPNLQQALGSLRRCGLAAVPIRSPYRRAGGSRPERLHHPGRASVDLCALQRRYPAESPAEDLASWNDAYADAMREVYRAYPEDLDVCALFAEAIMNRTPWALWDLKTGKPAEGGGYGRSHRSLGEGAKKGRGGGSGAARRLAAHVHSL